MFVCKIKKCTNSELSPFCTLFDTVFETLFDTLFETLFDTLFDTLFGSLKYKRQRHFSLNHFLLG